MITTTSPPSTTRAASIKPTQINNFTRAASIKPTQINNFTRAASIKPTIFIIARRDRAIEEATANNLTREDRVYTRKKQTTRTTPRG
jgi:hypothetical protein